MIARTQPLFTCYNQSNFKSTGLKVKFIC